MHSITTLTAVLSACLLISQTSAAPTSHKATIEDVTIKPTPPNIPRGTISEISDIVDIAEAVINEILGVITDIYNAQHEIESDFTNNMVDSLYASAPTANIMVCHDCSFDLDSGALFTHYELDISAGLGFTQGYDIAVFDSGTVQLNGDGGYINWCYSGIHNSFFVYRIYIDHMIILPLIQ
jgi:hypothetical protein